MNTGSNSIDHEGLRTRFMNADRDQASQGTMALINILQDMPVEKQVLSVACLFSLFAERFKKSASPVEFLELADRVLGSKYNSEFVAARAYMRHEW